MSTVCAYSVTDNAFSKNFSHSERINANTSSKETAKLFYDLGVKRVVFSREMTLEEINSIDKEAIERINRLVVSLRKFVRLDEAEQQDADVNKEIDLTLKTFEEQYRDVRGKGGKKLIKPEYLIRDYSSLK